MTTSVLSTEVDPAQEAADQVINIIQNTFIQMGASGLQGYNLIWNNPNASPIQIIHALGTRAVTVFKLANLNITCSQQAATIDGGIGVPDFPTIPEGWVLSPNTDGSMVVAPPMATVPFGLSAGPSENGTILNWSKSIGSLGYNIDKSVDGGTTWVNLVSHFKQTTYIDPSGVSGNQYRVSSIVSTGTSDYTNPVVFLINNG